MRAEGSDAGTGGTPQDVSGDAKTVVSRVVTGENGKSYVEVDGKPFMYENVECMGSWMRRGFDASTIKGFEEELPLSWMENVFDKTDQAGYNTVSTFFNWNDMEPKEEGVYDWTILDQYIEWAEKYNMRLSLTWFGSDAGGGTRLPGYGAGWSCHVPEYLCDQAKYWNRRGLATEDDKKRESRFRCIPGSAEGNYIKECEKKALIALTEHLRDTDKTHRMISLMINNESQNIPDSWHTELANAVKSVGYDFVIGQHMQKGQYKYREGYDFVGFDDYSKDLDYKLSYLNNSPTPLKACLETGGDAYNLSSQVLAGITNGGWIQAWQLCDAYSDCQQLGMFETPDAVYPEMIKPGGGVKPYSAQAGQDYDKISKPDYFTWTVGSQETLKYGGQKNRRLQLALRKAYWAVAPAAVEEMVSFNLETDEPVANYSASKGLNGHTFGFVSDGPDSVRKRGSNGMIVSTGDNGDEYFCLSDTGTEVTFITDEEPKSATYGHQHGYLPEEEKAGATGEWVKEGDVTVTEQTAEDGTKTWEVKCAPEQVIRLELSHANAAPVFEQDTVEKISVKNVTVSGTAKATDANYGDTVTYSVKEQPTQGTVTIETGENGECKWSYTPTKDWFDDNNPQTFKIAATDAKGGEGIFTVKITVREKSSIPVMKPETLSIELPKNTVTGGKCEATDEDEGDIQSFTTETAPQHGTLIVTEAGDWTYTPAKDYTGTDSFIIKVTDSYGDTANMTAHITVADTEAGTGTNLSRLEGVKAEATSSYASNPPEKAIDGDYTNCWSAAALKNIPVSLTIDLGGIHELNAVKYQVAANTSFEWRYKLEGSKDSSNWDVLTDRQAAGSKTTGNTMVAEQIEGQYRYVRWTVTGTTSNRDAASTREFEIWGSEDVISPDAHEPVIGTQPVGAEYSLGDTAKPLTVAATSDDGGIINYQWYKNTENAIGGSLIPGATEASYTPPTDQTGTTYYYCRVTNHNDHAVGTASVYLDSNIVAVVVKKELTGIVVTPPTKREYVQGETLSRNGLKVIAVYNSKIEEDVTDQAELTGYDGTKTGWQTVTVSFTDDGKTFKDTFDVYVKEKTEPAELNKNALQAAIDRTEGLVKDDYTSSSWAKYQTALTAALQAMESQTVTQDAVNTAATELREAIAALDRADKRSLNDAIKRAGEREEAVYTRLSWTAMQKKLAEAQKVVDNSDAVQSKIDDATYQLSEALRNLEERKAVRKVELGVVIARTESLIETDYTASSWASMKAALDQAKKITADEAAAQSEVNAASDALRKAINELAKMNKSGLQAAIDRANARNEADYQDKPEQWTAMKAAQAEAEQMMENKDAVQTEIDAVTKKLSEALRQLDPEGTINKEALKAVIARADALTKEDYTETGWAAMEEKLTAANRAVESDLVSQKEVNDAAEALRTALDTLEKYKADKAGLEAAITRADAIKEETYPDKKEEWKAMQDALTLSRGVAQNKDALQTEIDAATRQLNEAIRQLEAVKTVNKNALKAEIDRTVNLNQGDYTASSWTALQEKLTAANKAYESETATQEEVNAAAAALREAIAGLSRADKAGLNDAINRVKDRNEADYTAESWKAMQDVLATVKKVAEDPNATQAQIDEATRQLSEALRQLVKKDVVNKAALEKKYNEVKAVKADGYTAESYAALQTALKNAKAVLDKETATQAEVDAQVKALEDAVKGLKKAGSTAPVVKVSSIKISGISGKIAAGKKIQLSAVISPSNAANKQIKWTTSNKKIATVNSKGLVRIKAKTGGRSVTITAAAADGSGKKATYKIKIMKDAVKKVAISGKKTKSVKAGKKLQLKAKVTAAKKANKKLRWTCSNTKYATVNSKGKVTAKKAGKGKKVKITAAATDGSGKKSTVTIKIK